MRPPRGNIRAPLQPASHCIQRLSSTLQFFRRKQPDGGNQQQLSILIGESRSTGLPSVEDKILSSDVNPASSGRKATDVLTQEERDTLLAWSTSHTCGHLLQEGARVVLLAAEGVSAWETARRLRVRLNRVLLWKRHFNQERLLGLNRAARLCKRKRPVGLTGDRQIQQKAPSTWENQSFMGGRQRSLKRI